MADRQNDNNAAGATLRVMTWNVWWRFGPWRERRPVISETLAAVDADIFALQEVWSEGANDLAAELADERGYHHVHAAAVTIGGSGLGNAVLSRWPILQSDTAILPAAKDADDTRVVLYAEIDGPRAPIPFFVTHLTWPLDHGAVRQRQVCEVARFVEGKRPWQSAPILCGDFNAAPDCEEIAMLTDETRCAVDGLVFQDAWAFAGNGAGLTFEEANPHAAPELMPGRRIDYIFVGRPAPGLPGRIADCRLAGNAPVQGIWPSDHFAVVADLVL